jgi:hypothetical protein
VGALRLSLERAVGLSTSWLGVYRVLLGSTIILDLVVRSVSLSAHYGDLGVLPRSFVIAEMLEPGDWSLHLLFGGWQAQAVLFWINAMLALLLLAGVRPRLMAGLCFVFMASLHSRNPMLVTGADNLLRVMLFWSMFVPLRRLPASEGDVVGGGRTVASVGTAAYMLQLCFMYWFTFLLKTGPAWREDFTALEQALQFEHYTKVAGVWLLGWPSLLAPLTIAVLVLEAIGPMLVFIPWRTGVWRTLAVALFWSFHLGIALTLEFGLFPWICMLVWIPLLPESLATRLRAVLPVGILEPVLAWFQGRPAMLEYRLGRMGSVLVIALLGYVLAWNIRTLDLERHQKWFPREASWLGRVLHIDQRWALFTPEPPSDNGWYVVPVYLESGLGFDYMTGGPITWEKPGLISAMYGDHRWRKYFLSLRDDTRVGHRRCFAEYVCRGYSGAEMVEMFYVVDTGRAEDRYRLLFIEHRCANEWD